MQNSLEKLFDPNKDEEHLRVEMKDLGEKKNVFLNR